MFQSCVVIFTISSLLCGASNSIVLLVSFRLLQAIGGGGIVPSINGMIVDHYGRYRDRLIGLLLSLHALGSMLGPVLGGVIVTYTSWRVIFLINVPLGIGLVALMAWLLPGDRPRTEVGFGVDLIATGLFAASLLALMIGLGQVGARGFGSAATVGSLAASVLFGVAFFAREARTSHPIFAPALFKRRSVVVINGLNVLYGAAAFGAFNLVPLYGQAVFGMQPITAGALVAVRAAALAVLSVITSLFVMQRFGYRRPIAVGFVAIAGGLAMLALPPYETTAFVWLGLASLMSGIGVGIAGPPSNNAALDLMPDQVASMAGLRIMFRQIGGIVAISTSGAVLTISPLGPRALEWMFAVLAVLMVAAIPFVAAIPERTGVSPHFTPT
jgi:MFS family permease